MPDYPAEYPTVPDYPAGYPASGKKTRSGLTLILIPENFYPDHCSGWVYIFNPGTAKRLKFFSEFVFRNITFRIILEYLNALDEYEYG